MSNSNWGKLMKLVHLHIFKNGGSTLDWILERNFQHKFTDLHGDTPTSTILMPDIAEFFQKNPAIVALTSHHFRFPIDDHLDDETEVLPLVFLRHPIDRIYSVYAQEIRHGLVAEMNSAESFRNWIKSNMTNRPDSLFNVQTNLFANGGNYEAADDASFSRACGLLENLKFCGVVEEFDESMLVLEQHFKSSHLDLDGAYVRKNKTQGRCADLHKRINFIREALGDELFECLINSNCYDIQLWEMVRQKLADQIEAVRFYRFKMTYFKTRCLFWATRAYFLEVLYFKFPIAYRVIYGDSEP